MSSESFGPKLRWRRIRAGVSLEQVSAQTKLPLELWQAMEVDDFSGWPTGIYARAPLREYANIIGLDADAVIDDFCRAFPEKGDRRKDSVLRGQAQIVGHKLAVDEPLPAGVLEDRRAASRTAAKAEEPARRRTAIDLRIAAAIVDQAVVIGLAAVIGIALRGHFWTALAVMALIYHGAGVASTGGSFGGFAVRAYLTRHPQGQAPSDVFAPVPRSIEHSSTTSTSAASTR